MAISLGQLPPKFSRILLISCVLLSVTLLRVEIIDTGDNVVLPTVSLFWANVDWMIAIKERTTTVNIIERI